MQDDTNSTASHLQKIAFKPMRDVQTSISKVHLVLTHKCAFYSLFVLLCAQIAIQCLNLAAIAKVKFIDPLLDSTKFDPASFHILYELNNLLIAVLCVGILAPFAFLFCLARISFGYMIACYLYMMALGYMWLNSFSDLHYDHTLYGISIATSTIAFILPALFISSPIKQAFVLSKRGSGRALTFILVAATGAVAAGAYYNFRIVSVSSIYNFRNELNFPSPLRYLLSINSSVLLPFAFAAFLERKNRWGATAALLLLLLLYPVTLAKVALFAPVWFIFIALLASLLEARTSIVLSLLLPTAVGLIVVMFGATSYFLLVNFRMIAIPSIALDFYSHYFSTHGFTHFCQIWIIKPFVTCAYQESLSVLMQQTYHLGFFNASLFATEGIASAGPYLSPVAVFLCGLIIALGNRLSAGLPPRFIITSSAIVGQVILNVPLSTTLLTHGLAILYLLWYITPRDSLEVGAPSFLLRSGLKSY
jgi:hypothetical protein